MPAKKEQTFVTAYKFQVEHELRESIERIVRSWVLVLGEEKHNLGTDRYDFTRRDGLVAWVRDHGGLVIEEQKTETDSPAKVRPVWLGPALQQIETDLKERVGCEDDRGRGSIYVNDYQSRADIETPTRLGKGEHFARRALVESWFKEHGIKFEIECATKHSELVCQPLNLVMPETAPEVAP